MESLVFIIKGLLNYLIQISGSRVLKLDDGNDRNGTRQDRAITLGGVTGRLLLHDHIKVRLWLQGITEYIHKQISYKTLLVFLLLGIPYILLHHRILKMNYKSLPGGMKLVLR